MRLSEPLSERSEPQGKGAWLVCGEGSDERPVGNSGSANRLLLSVDLARGSDGPGKGNPHVIRRLPVKFNHAKDDLVASLRFFNREHTDAGITQVQQRKAL